MFCKHCGMKIDEDSSFCPKCGKQLLSEGNIATTSHIQNKEIDSQSGMCCPQCGYGNLQVTTETSTQTVGKNFSLTQGCLGYLLLGPLGILCGACGQGQHTTTTNKTYWVCPKCGKKFRDLEEQRNIIKNMRASRFSFPLFCLLIFALFVSLPCAFGAESEAVWIAFGVGLLTLGLMGILSYVSTVKSIEKSEEALEELEDAIYNHEKVDGNAWKCPQCGRTNQSYTGTCACGQTKS